MTLASPPPGRTVSRRQFLSGTLAASVLVWATGSLEAGPRRLLRRDLFLTELNLATFTNQLDTHFRILDAPQGPVELKLIEARAHVPARHSATALDAQFEKFSLCFSGPKELQLPQQIYRFEHPRLGWFAMFIVPIVTRAATQQHYEAIFNRPASVPVPLT